MTEQNKNEIMVNQSAKLSTAAPKLTLDVMSKVYLATAVKSVGKLTFVYTLACTQTPNAKYDLYPKTEIATFDNEKDAAIYHKTINEIMRVQANHIGIQQIKRMLADEVKNFKTLIR